MALEIREGIDPKQYFPDERHIIEYAFTLGKKHYFKFSDLLNLPYERALSCLVYYREVDMNVDRDLLKEHCQAIEKALMSNPINVFNVKALNDLLLQRLNLPKDPELMYKLASVVYFDQNERPEVYEWKHGEKKIEYWKQEASVTDFFLSKPLKDLIPYLAYAEENFNEFSRLIQDHKNRHSEKLSAVSSASSKTN